MVDISIIIVGYKSETKIKRLLDSIQNGRDKLTKEVIFVDNYCQDDSVKIVGRHPLKPIIIANPQNEGFSKAVNKGIKVSKGKYILLVNPDTRIIGKSIKYLFNFAEQTPNLGAVAPMLLNDNGRIQPSAFYLPSIKNAVLASFFGQKKRFGKFFPGRKTTRVEAAVMACLLIPRKVIDTIGPLDERFFLYYEDVEYCKRIKDNHLDIYYFPKAKVKHTHGASGNFSSHLNSPLAKSSIIYHGALVSRAINLILWSSHKLNRAIEFINHPGRFFKWLGKKYF